MKHGEWFFDFVSPFAYLQLEQLQRAPPRGLELKLQPVLFAGLLQHWGQLGPAEIHSKRRFTYRHVQWLADRLDIPLRFPTAHPFNPLPLLRLAVAAGGNPQIVSALFRFVWSEGRRPDDEHDWRALSERQGIAELAGRIGEPAVKQTLRATTDRAIALGVFGVPTLVVDGELFWGLDSTEFLLDYLEHPDLLESEPMRRAAALPMAASRRR